MSYTGWTCWIVREETSEFEIMALSKKPTYSSKLVLGLIINRLNEIYEKIEDGV